MDMIRFLSSGSKDISHFRHFLKDGSKETDLKDKLQINKALFREGFKGQVFRS